MIIDNFFLEQFIDPATAPGTPLTGITATINIWSVSGGVMTQVVTSASCTNQGNGFYGYLFTAMQPSTWYVYEIVPSATAYRVPNWVDYRMEKMDTNISDMRVGGGGGGNYSQAIQTALSNTKTALEKKIEEEHNKTRKTITDGNDENYSHIEFAKDETIGKIESIPTTDLSDLNKSLGVARQQLTKLSDFLRKEAESEKNEMKKEYEGKISELETTIDGIEAMFEEFKGMSEEEKKTLLESKENELKEITEFADEAIEYYKEMKDSAKTEGEEEIKSKLKSLL